MKLLNIQYFPPNYLYVDNFDEFGVIIDVGCGHKAEFSKHMIEKHNMQAFGVDPTIKHSPYLKEFEKSSKGKFMHLSLAVTSHNGIIKFHESKKNESGSILVNHVNVKNDDITIYNVESVSLKEL